MTNQELNARAAEIMGWKQVHSINDETDIVKSLNSPMVLQRQDGIIIYALEEDLDTPIWNPAENIAQAFELAEKFKRYSVSKNSAREYPYCAWVEYELGSRIEVNDKSKALAITRACVAAEEKAK